MIFGLAGRIHSGKDTIGRVLIEQLGFKRVAFADGVRDKVAETYGWDRAWVYSDDFKNALAVIYNAATMPSDVTGNRKPIGGREVLQREGMAARKVFGDDCWIKVALAKCAPGICKLCGKLETQHIASLDGKPKCVEALLGAARVRHHRTPPSYIDSNNYVITDVRFPNELAAIKAAGGKVVRLNRAESLETCHPFELGVHDAVSCGFTLRGGVHTPRGLEIGENVCSLPPSAHPASNSPDQHPSEVSLPDDSQHAYGDIAHAPELTGERITLDGRHLCQFKTNNKECGLPREAHPTDPVIYDGVATGPLEENTAAVLGLVKGWLGR